MLWALVIVLAIISSASADMLCDDRQAVQKCKKSELDIVTKKKTQSDLIKQQHKIQQQKQADTLIRTKQENVNSSSIINTIDKTDFTSTPTSDNTLKVYVGPCVYSAKAIKDANNFLAKHKEFTGQFLMTATREKYEFTENDVGGVEFYLPLDADKYNITSVPSFIFIIGGKEYKVSGLVNIEEAYSEIINGKAQLQNRGQYAELETKGKGCPSVYVDLTPVRIPTSEVAKLEKENKPPDLNKLLNDKKINLPLTDSPISIDYKIEDNQYLPFSKYIVFSQVHKKWAKNLVEQGAMGCCIDCETLDDLFPYIQICSEEMLKEMSVKSVPAIVNVKEK